MPNTIAPFKVKDSPANVPTVPAARAAPPALRSIFSGSGKRLAFKGRGGNRSGATAHASGAPQDGAQAAGAPVSQTAGHGKVRAMGYFSKLEPGSKGAGAVKGGFMSFAASRSKRNAGSVLQSFGRGAPDKPDARRAVADMLKQNPPYSLVRETACQRLDDAIKRGAAPESMTSSQRGELVLSLAQSILESFISGEEAVRGDFLAQLMLMSAESPTLSGFARDLEKAIDATIRNRIFIRGMNAGSLHKALQGASVQSRQAILKIITPEQREGLAKINQREKPGPGPIQRLRSGALRGASAAASPLGAELRARCMMGGTMAALQPAGSSSRLAAELARRPYGELKPRAKAFADRCSDQLKVGKEELRSYFAGFAALESDIRRRELSSDQRVRNSMPAPLLKLLGGKRDALKLVAELAGMDPGKKLDEQLLSRSSAAFVRKCQEKLGISLDGLRIECQRMLAAERMDDASQPRVRALDCLPAPLRSACQDLDNEQLNALVKHLRTDSSSARILLSHEARANTGEPLFKAEVLTDLFAKIASHEQQSGISLEWYCLGYFNGRARLEEAGLLVQ